MPPDLGLVAHSADADADELAAHGPRDALAQAGLAHAGRPGEAEDRPRHLALQLLHGQELEDAVFHVLEVVVVLVEDRARVGDVDVVLGDDRPGQRHDPVEIGADDAVLGGSRRQLRQPVELTPRLLVDLLGQVGLVDALAQLVDLGLGLVGLAQLFLDGLQLLAQHVLALVLVHLRLHLVLDLGAELQHFQLPVHEGGERAQPARQVGLFEQLLLVLGLEAHGRGDEVAERRRVVDAGGRHLELVGQIGHQGDDLGVDRHQVALEGLQLGAGFDHVGQIDDVCPQVGSLVGELARSGCGGCPGR